MKQNNESKIEMLNELIEINNDRIEGYMYVKKAAIDDELIKLFSSFETDSYRFKLYLINEVSILGGIPVNGTTISGKFYRVWMALKAALTGNDIRSIVSSCIFGEETALSVYKIVLTSEIGLGPKLRRSITDQKHTIQRAHLQLKQYLTDVYV